MIGTNALATGATVALLLTTGASVAQQERGNPPSVEKMAPEGAKQPSAVNHQNEGGQKTPGGRAETPHNQIGEVRKNPARPETTGQVPREDQPNRLNERASEPRRGETEQGRSSERNGQAPATGQAPRDGERRSRATEESGATGRAPREDDKSRASEQERRKGDREENVGTVGRDATRARESINITAEKRNQIHEAILHERNAPRVRSVNFDLSVGVKIPRDVRFATLPETIVAIEPAWRGFEFFMIGEEIVIVDPRSLEIVAVVDA